MNSIFYRMMFAACAALALCVSCSGTEPLHESRVLLKDAAPAEYRIRFVYAIPSDGVDHQFDQKDVFRRSIERLQNWMVAHADGRRFRIAQDGLGRPEILFVQLESTDADLISHGVRIRDEIEKLLKNARMLRRNELYLLYYDGTGIPKNCSNSAWPPQLPGTVAVKYLQGAGGNRDCAAPERAYGDDMNRFEFGTIHEIFHLLGAVPTCAPHHVLAGHVGDDPHDLMYAGPAPWQPSEIDIGRDDYFGHANPNCLDVARSPFLEMAR